MDEELLTTNVQKQAMNIKSKRFGAEGLYAQQQLNSNFFGNGDRIKELEENDQDNLVDMLNENDILDLVKGKTVLGMKLDKEQRQQLKFAIKRDEPTESILTMIEEYVYGVRGTKYDGFDCKNKNKKARDKY